MQYEERIRELEAKARLFEELWLSVANLQVDDTEKVQELPVDEEMLIEAAVEVVHLKSSKMRKKTQKVQTTETAHPVQAKKIRTKQEAQASTSGVVQPQSQTEEPGKSRRTGKIV